MIRSQTCKILCAAWLFTCSADAQDKVTGPLHLVVSEVGNCIVEYGKGDDLEFTVMAEIGSSLNFSVRGDFKSAKIEKASVIAPDGKTYELAALGEQPPNGPGNLRKFLSIKFGEAQSGFSIGRWKVRIEFMVDGKTYNHKAEYLVTWRKPGQGIWGRQEWANDSKDAEQAGADQPATKPADKPPVKGQPSTPTSKDGPR
jgi:hypothetical protein